MEILLIANFAVGAIIIYLVLTRHGKDSGVTASLTQLEKNQEKLERVFKEEMLSNRNESSENDRKTREELGKALASSGEVLDKRMGSFSKSQAKAFEGFSLRLTTMTEKNEQRMDRVKEAIEQRLDLIRKDNGEKLEKMRETVDEKLHATLEKRLGESFKQVSDRLEQVHKGLGEMQTLASGVGDLKKVLTNVKTRGTWGEVQLGSLLEQILTSEQFSRNVAVKSGSAERVDFAINLPGKDKDQGVTLLPIDAKFPLEDYQKLVEAQDAGDLVAVEAAGKALESRVKLEAKAICSKYMNPPQTTDFSILYLPVEGLYAEVLRRPGLWEWLQRECKVIITGPTTIAAILNSLQMGFRTLAIEKRSSEVWTILESVRGEFTKFGDLLEKTERKLGEASNTIRDAAAKSRNIEGKLRKVQQLPQAESIQVIAAPEVLTLPVEEELA